MTHNNCYAYATNGIGHLQPGGAVKDNEICSTLIQNIKIDGHRQIECSAKCATSEYKIMSFTAPYVDFHFYRQEKSGLWSHKFPRTEPTLLDASGKNINDPVLANRYYNHFYNYSNLCGCFCVNNTE